MFGDLGFPEMIVILVIALVFFGPSKLPALGQGLGEAIRNFKKSVAEGDTEDRMKMKANKSTWFGMFL